MKKRKPPFALFSVLVVLIAGAVYLSNKQMTASGMQPAAQVTDDGHGHSEEEHVAEQQQPAAPSAEEVAREATSVVNAGDAPKSKIPDAMREKMLAMQPNTIVMPEGESETPQRQLPKEAGSQWWKEGG